MDSRNEAEAKERRRNLGPEAGRDAVRAVKNADTDELRRVVEDVLDNDIPAVDGFSGTRGANVQHWLYKKLKRGRYQHHTPEERVRVVRALFAMEMSEGQIRYVFGMGKGAVSEAVRDLQHGYSVGLDGKDYKRGEHKAGGRPRLDMTGRTFGHLTVLERTERAAGGRWHWRCRCTCGAAVKVRQDNLAGGRQTSCGCRQGLPPYRQRQIVESRMVTNL